jgi:Family of unknown function (DUF6184)
MASKRISKLVQCSLLGVACLTACVACNKTGPDRDGNQPRDFDDKSGSSAPAAPGERVGVTTVTGADMGALSNDLAVERIVAARCARETQCNNVGSDKHFVDHDTCAVELRKHMGTDLRAAECPRGIDGTALDTCMESIRSESCNNPIDTIQRLAACRTAELCLKTNEKTR